MFHLQRHVYLDNNATTTVAPHVARVMSAVLKRRFGNPSSLYRLGREAASIVEDARQVVATTINAEPDEIIFTGSATEANNQVLTVADGHPLPQHGARSSPRRSSIHR